MSMVDDIYQELQELNQLTGQNCETIFQIRSIPSQILLTHGKGILYLSGRSILSLYKQYKIDHLISLTPLQNILPDIQHDILEIDDNSNPENLQKLENNMTNILENIYKSIIEGNVVCVHCNAGVSRSVTLVIAYLMKYDKLTWYDALKQVQHVRPVICPNRGFLQLLSNLTFK